MARADHFANLVAPSHRFLWGVSLLFLFLFSRGLFPRFLQLILFAVLSTAAGKRIRYLYFVILTFSITLFHLLTPWGSLLFSFAGFPVTEGALLEGLTKGVTISGLVFVSLFSVSKELVLPGRFGRLLGKSFFYFESLYTEKRRIRRASFLSDIDDILLSLFPPDSVTPEGTRGAAATTISGAVVILISLGVGASLALTGRYFS